MATSRSASNALRHASYWWLLLTALWPFSSIAASTDSQASWSGNTFYLLLAAGFFIVIIAMIIHQRRQKHRALILAKNNAVQSQQNARLAQHHAEKANQAKSLFIADISHEIRTPLNAILGYAQLLVRDPSLNPAQKQKMDVIEQSGSHLLGLINNVLDLSKIEADAMTVFATDFELNDLIQGIGAMLDVECEEKGLDWQFINHCDETLPVHGDQVKVRQILINLLSNAIKFTHQGSVTLTLSSTASDHYRFEVDDNGEGIAVEHQQKIFQAFGQTLEGVQQGGTGLGLTIAHKQIALMGGQLQLTSTKGAGSCFYFPLPLPPAKTPITRHHDNSSDTLKLAPGVNVSALVVDDINSNVDVLRQALRQIGIEVCTADSGQQALAQLHQTSILPDLIFIDIKMPIIDGVALLQQLQQDFEQRCPLCVAVTAHVMQQDIERYFNAGFVHVITKPFRFSTINQAVSQLLDVSFEQPSTASSETTRTMPITDFSSLKIPPQLYKTLRQGAEDYEVDKLEDTLSEVANISEQGREFALHLSQYIANYDMDGFIVELEQLTINH